MDITEKRVKECRGMIVSLVKEPSLCTNLMSFSVITEDEACRVRTMMQNDTFKANEIMMDCVFKSQQPGKWTSFMEALRKSGFSDSIGRALMSPNDKTDIIKNHILNTIQHFTADLAEQIIGGTGLANILYSKHVLNDVDLDNIKHEYKNNGNYAANVMLLDRMKSRLTPRRWYCEFLQALIDTGCEHLVETIEPKFISNKEHLLKQFEVVIYSNMTGKNQYSIYTGSQDEDGCYIDISFPNKPQTDAKDRKVEVDNLTSSPKPSGSLDDTELFTSDITEDEQGEKIETCLLTSTESTKIVIPSAPTMQVYDSTVDATVSDQPGKIERSLSNKHINNELDEDIAIKADDIIWSDDELYNDESFLPQAMYIPEHINVKCVPFKHGNKRKLPSEYISTKPKVSRYPFQSKHNNEDTRNKLIDNIDSDFDSKTVIDRETKENID